MIPENLTACNYQFYMNLSSPILDISCQVPKPDIHIVTSLNTTQITGYWPSFACVDVWDFNPLGCTSLLGAPKHR